MKCTEDRVTLSERGRRFADQLGLSERDLKSARAGSVSSTDGTQFLIIWGELPDGRRVRMLCPFHMPCHIVTFRPMSD